MFEMLNLWRPWDEDGGDEKGKSPVQVKRADCEVYNILFEMTTSVEPSVPSIIFLQLYFAPCLKCFFSLAYANKKFEARV